MLQNQLTFKDFGSPNDWKHESIVNQSSCDDVAVTACSKKRNFAVRQRIYSKTGEPPDASFAILYPSSWHRLSTSLCIDFEILYESSMNSNGFPLPHIRYSLLLITSKPEICNLAQENNGFVVLPMPPWMAVLRLRGVHHVEVASISENGTKTNGFLTILGFMAASNRSRRPRLQI